MQAELLGGVRTARKALWHLRHGGPSQVRKYLRRRRILGDTARGGARAARGGGLVFDPWPLPDRHPARRTKVGVILDDFSRLAFGYEWDQVRGPPVCEC